MSKAKESFFKEILMTLGMVVFLVFIIVVKLLFPSSSPDELGCETAERSEGWSSCQLIDHSSSADSRNCDKRDRHSYRVRGRDSRGHSSEVTVCCRELHGQCRVSAE